MIKIVSGFNSKTEMFFLQKISVFKNQSIDTFYYFICNSMSAAAYIFSKNLEHFSLH